MKIAYNACFGGFGLSPLAETEYAKRKGINLTWYEQVGYKHEGDERYIKVEGIPDSNRYTFKALKSDLGDEITSIPDGESYYVGFSEEEVRADPDLIDIIESMGEKSHGAHASLQVVEIPDGSSFEITEYDGMEEVVPPRQSW